MVWTEENTQKQHHYTSRGVMKKRKGEMKDSYTNEVCVEEETQFI